MWNDIFSLNTKGFCRSCKNLVLQRTFQALRAQSNPNPLNCNNRNTRIFSIDYYWIMFRNDN